MNKTTAAYDKASLLAMFQPKIVSQPVAGVGSVLFRELSAPEVSDIRDLCQSKDKKADFGFKLVIASLVDESGQPVFTDADLPSLRSSAQVRIGNLVTAVMAVNGFQLDAKAAEDAAKN